MLMAKQRYLTERIRFSTAYDLEERLFLSTHYGKKSEYILPISKKDLAAGTGTVSETLSMLLGRFEKEGNLTVEENRIRTAGSFREEKECNRRFVQRLRATNTRLLELVVFLIAPPAFFNRIFPAVF